MVAGGGEGGTVPLSPWPAHCRPPLRCAHPRRYRSRHPGASWRPAGPGHIDFRDYNFFQIIESKRLLLFTTL